MLLALVEARFPTGRTTSTSCCSACAPQDEGWTEGRVEDVDGATIYDAFADPATYGRIGRMLAEQATVQGDDGCRQLLLARGRRPAPAGRAGPRDGRRAVQQLGRLRRRYVLKAFRRLEAGDNPELEMLRFLTEREFPHIAELVGWIDYAGELMDATLGVAQRFVAGGRDGWELALDELASDPEAFVARMEDLGAVIGRMHTGSPPTRATRRSRRRSRAWSRRRSSPATIDEQIERLFVDLPADNPTSSRSCTAARRCATACRCCRTSAPAASSSATTATCTSARRCSRRTGWIVLDFEGEPARPLLERRRKRSPLRDVAGHAALVRLRRRRRPSSSAARRARGLGGPHARGVPRRLLRRRRPGLLPPGEANARTLLTIFELEKAVYELRYELNNRPDWVRIPVAGIARLLEEPCP
jgi:hypothetical protein